MLFLNSDDDDADNIIKLTESWHVARRYALTIPLAWHYVDLFVNQQ